MSDLLYYEDLPVGARFDLGNFGASEEEIIALARQYDPQPFHVDPAAAAQSPYGGVIASGWQTGVLAMRLLVDGLLLRCAALGSPGVDSMRFLLPVRPGDTIRVQCTIVDARPSASKADRGVLTLRSEGSNQHGLLVFSMEAKVIFRRRPTATATA